MNLKLTDDKVNHPTRFIKLTLQEKESGKKIRNEVVPIRMLIKSFVRIQIDIRTATSIFFMICVISFTLLVLFSSAL